MTRTRWNFLHWSSRGFQDTQTHSWVDTPETVMPPAEKVFCGKELTRSSATADRPCDCLRPKSPLCSCQHCQWFCAGRDAELFARQEWRNWSAICQMSHEILVTQYDQFRTGVGHFQRIFDREGGITHNHCWCQKTRVITVSCGIKISVVHHLVLPSSVCQTDRWTDGQTDRIAKAIPCVAVHTVAW